ncbi:tetraacyldisaccharide 4'-kinase [Odoribacter lunatus]|uniref:tetraacyldisaccharide 4'-kinase n=1 Tax=Odoribacter lunatus TaxID=2941335 RepID=UPI00203F59FC|nr:tetraacyldisaccharide 4'-kinase [Odoribacter lunatus]
MAFLKVILLPLSCLYGFIVGIRNFFFNNGILKSKSFSIPIICVGNISVGGTGKTPHTEQIISALSNDFQIACLSRGYKRHTKGFILAKTDSTADEIGDEPLQIKNKFPNIQVACDAKRTRGIEKLLSLSPQPEVIILDDAFQHRYVKADKNIVLIDYNHPCYKDYLLPAGRLRETCSALKRADYLIVTKCPETLSPIEQRLFHKHLKIKPYQQLFFTTMRYGSILSLKADLPAPCLSNKSSILCVTGIAHPAPYIQYLRQFTSNITVLEYPDHHHFSKRDIRHITSSFEEILNTEKYIFTTEKDASRLKGCQLPQEIKEKIYYIPIEPIFLNKKELFIQDLKNYVTKNKK